MLHQNLAIYNLFIFAGEKNNRDKYSNAAIQFALDVDDLPSSPISYPDIWPEFFEDGIEIIQPKNSRFIDWPTKFNTAYSKILVRSSDTVRLSAALKQYSTDKIVKNATLVNFDHETNIWHCLFAPTSANISFELTLYAKRLNENKSHSIVEFILPSIPNEVLKQTMTFPEVYLPFYNTKCRLIEPLHGILQRSSNVHFTCQIPGAELVHVIVDGNWIKGGPWKPGENDIFDGYIAVGQEEVIIYVKFNAKKDQYVGLLKYTVS